MTKIKVSELTGAALNWAVERALGTFWSANGYFVFRYEGCGPAGFVSENPQWRYSTDWSQGGPIIEQELIELSTSTTGPNEPALEWRAFMHCNVLPEFGPTPLIAAMRCFVASKLGEEVDIPDELLK